MPRRCVRANAGECGVRVSPTHGSCGLGCGRAQALRVGFAVAVQVELSMRLRKRLAADPAARAAFAATLVRAVADVFAAEYSGDGDGDGTSAGGAEENAHAGASVGRGGLVAAVVLRSLAHAALLPAAMRAVPDCDPNSSRAHAVAAVRMETAAVADRGPSGTDSERQTELRVGRCSR